MGKIVFFPLLAGHGNLNIGLSISNRIFQLYGDEHEIYWLVNGGYAEKIRKINPKIKCAIYRHPALDNETDQDAFTIKMLNAFGSSLRMTDRVQFVNHFSANKFKFLEQYKQIYGEITEILKQIKPDFFIYDQIMTTPIGIDQGIPHALLLSMAPTYLGYEKLPPHQSGLPTEYTAENLTLWNDFLKQTWLQGKSKEVHDELNEWLKETKCPGNLDDFYHTLVPSKYFNILNYPKVVDYEIPQKVELPGRWLKIQSAILPPLPKPFELPEKLAKLNKKTIYVSVGSMSSSYKPLMEHIVEVLSQLPNYEFILSGGPLLDQLKLSENIYAERFVNQLAVLQSVTCAVTHGGNNTFTECFYIGVPQIVMPLFADQIENGTRIKEKGLGGQLNPFEFTKEQLGEEIERLTTPEMLEKYKKLSAEIRADTGIDKVCEKIVSYCK